MIGGQDNIFAVWSGPTAIDYCVRLISEVWPDRVFVVDRDPAVHSDFGSLVLHEQSELLLYRDRAACDAWDELGYDESLRDTMVYLLSRPNQLTVVTDHDPSPETVSLLLAIGAGLPTAFPLSGRTSQPQSFLEAA